MGTFELLWSKVGDLMTYNELRSKVEQDRKNVSKAKHRKRKIEEELKDLRESKHSIEVNFQKEVASLKGAAHDAYVANVLQPYETEIAAIERNITNSNNEYTRKLADLTEENVSDRYTGEQEIMAEIKTSLNVLQDVLEKVISPRFQRELETQLDQQQISMDDQNLEVLIDYFNKQSYTIDKMSKKSFHFDVMGYLNNQFLLSNPLDTIGNQEVSIGSLDRGKLNLAVLVIVLALITFVAAKYVFPLYLIAITFYSSYNIAKNYKIFNAIIAQKVIKDNIQQVDDSLRQKVLDEIEKEKVTLQEKHEATLSMLEKQLSQKKNEMNNAAANAEGTFVYDAGSAQQSFEAAMRSKENKENSLIEEQNTVLVQLEDFYKELKASEELLKSMAGSIQAQYLDLDKVGSSVIFEPTFIFDVKDTKPVFFVHPESSVLFLYDEPGSVIDFVRLLSTQLRIKLNPFNLTITVVDQRFMGTEYLLMQPVSDSSDDSIKKLYQILTSKSEVDERLMEYNDDILKRIKNIKRSFKDIKDYNNYMVEHESLPEAYDFFFFQDPDTGVLQDKVLQQLLINGASVGIFTHLFIKDSEYYEMGDSARKLVESVGAIYVLKEGELYKRAKDFVLEKMIKSSNS